MMEDTDDTLDDWTDLISDSNELLSGFMTDPCFTNSVSDVFGGGVYMSNSEVNLGEEEEMRVGSVLLVDNNPIADDNPGVGLPCLTIPSGFSPNDLFGSGSPVMLPNSQLSPTTGTLDSSPVDQENQMMESPADKEHEGDGVSAVDPGSMSLYHPSQYQNFRVEDPSQSFIPVQPQSGFRYPGQQDNVGVKNMELESSADTKIPFMKAESGAFQLSSHSYGTTQVSDGGGCQPAEGQKGQYSSAMSTKTAEDGYNWRKYGQKQVKGSDYPRSYFRCTNASCLVKKKVERSHDGEITEIIYKGAHNHQKPQPSRRPTAPCGESGDVGEGSGSCVKADPIWQGSEWRCEVDSAETPELSSTEEDTTTQGSLSIGEEDDAESESKRRKKESSVIETALGSRALREPRVIVQIESEVDIIDDGYRWRKYGQKVVKGNPNPRSYYKCTSAGCTVRKHVERASHNLKFVLTTYEGKHNHVVPAARNSSAHINSGSGHLPSSTSQPRNSHLPKPEPQDFVPPFDRKMDYESEFLRPNYLGGFGSVSSLYHMKFPAIPSSGMYGAFGLNPNYASSAPPMIPTVRDLSIPLPMNFSLPPSFAMGGYNNQGRPLNPVPPFYMGQSLKEHDVKVLRPKQEQRD